jgi:hypothetical protein
MMEAIMKEDGKTTKYLDMADLSNNILIIKETSRTLRPTERETIKMFKKVIQEPGKMIKDME